MRPKFNRDNSDTCIIGCSAVGFIGLQPIEGIRELRAKWKPRFSVYRLTGDIHYLPITHCPHIRIRASTPMTRIANTRHQHK